MIQTPRHETLPLRVGPPSKSSGDGLSLQPKEREMNGARSSKGQTDGGSGRRSRPKRPPQRIGREGEQLRGTARRERHRQAMAATRRCHRLLLQEMVTTPVTHAPLAARLGSRRTSRKEDIGATGLNPSIIFTHNRKNKTDIPTLTICVSILVTPRYFDEECHITKSW